MDQSEVVEIRVSVNELQLGMSVIRLDRPWLETSFPVQGFVIRHAADIEALKEQCRYVYVEGQEVVDRRGRRLTGANGRRKRQVPRLATVDMESEMPSARAAHESTRAMAEEIMQSAQMDRTIDVRRASETVRNCVDSVMRNQEALQILVQMRTKDDYTAQHGMNVCILAAIFGRHLGLLTGEIEKLALSGLVHDVGKMRIPEEILKKPDSLTEDEQRLIREHPTHGSRILANVRGLDPVAVDVAHSHHEHMNGNGYPRGLIAHQIPYFAKIVAILDAYDAITSDRVYQSAKSSKEALDIIYQGRGDQFDENLALDFIQCIGVYPAGSLVELNSGEAGIIITTYALNRLRPRVLVVRDPDGEPCRQRVVDLRRQDQMASGQPYKIRRELPIGAHGIDLNTFLEEGLQLHDEDPDPDTSTLINALKGIENG